ncbi:MAG: acetyl-CoA carboxylase biotin carboxyl carrier protein subunit [Deltaproteobacteria bacterium]|nr:acetyl-CoA carboxylase biotin carboxyl carrier protein subunit [Deltaproteobacteria bacterium]
MRFVANINNKKHEISVKPLEDDLFSITLDGHEYQVDAHVMPSGIVNLITNAKSYDVDIDSQNSADALDGNLTVRIQGRVVNLELLDEHQSKLKSARAASLSGSGSSEIRAPMPGRILRVLVQEGDLVEEGQGLVVMEAMKMENEIRASKAGQVKELAVQAGASVESGALLLAIE